MKALPSALESILTDIQRALDAKLYYLAVSACIGVPDICVALECEPDKIWTNEKKYKSWFDANMASYFTQFNSQDCWALRGGVVHNAKLFGHKQARYDRVIFTLPNPNFRVAEMISANNGGIEESALCLDIEMFCQRVSAAARAWLISKKDDPNVRANMPGLVRSRPEGLSPHVVGIPVIA